MSGDGLFSGPGGADSVPDKETLERWDDETLWHPFTPQSVYREEDPLLVVAGERNYLIDADGRRYLDGVASVWCNALGHRRPEIDRAIQEQLGRIAHATLLGNANVPAVTLARRLVDLAPGDLGRVFFSDDGSTAVEVALKVALQFWQQADDGAQRRRTKFLALGDAYHGDTVGSVSLGGIGLFHDRFQPLLFDVIRAPSPAALRRPRGVGRRRHQSRCLEETLELVREHGPELAAVVLEPGFQGAAGIVPYPGGYVREIGEAAREAGSLLVFDEVAAGMGRTGTMFACEREGIVPDLLCLAKMLTGGYLPLAATLTTERVYEAFLGPPDENRTLFHGHTYTGNSLGAAAALAVLDVFEEERVLEGLPEKIERLGEEMSCLEERPGVAEVRQCGLAAGIELMEDPEARKPYPPGERMGVKVCLAAREKGVFLRPLGDVVVLMPPLSVTLPEIETLVEAVEHGIRKVCGP